MGVRLIVEVLDHAPPGLTPAERIVLIVIAEAANDNTREAWPSLDTIARRAGLKPASVSQVFLRLAKREPPLEVRVPLMTGRDGRPVYAYEGRRTTYRLPDLRQRADQHRPSPQEARPASALSRPEGRPPSDRGPTTVGQRADHGRALTLKEPSKNPAAARAEKIITDATDATPDEARAVIALIEQTDQPRSLCAFLRHLANEGDLTTRLEKIRATQRHEEIAATVAAARRDAPCEHGDPGGANLHPATGLPLCALCRRDAPQERAVRRPGDHPWNPDEDGDCIDCPLPREHRCHA